MNIPSSDFRNSARGGDEEREEEAGRRPALAHKIRITGVNLM